MLGATFYYKCWHFKVTQLLEKPTFRVAIVHAFNMDFKYCKYKWYIAPNATVSGDCVDSCRSKSFTHLNDMTLKMTHSNDNPTLS